MHKNSIFCSLYISVRLLKDQLSFKVLKVTSDVIPGIFANAEFVLLHLDFLYI